MERLPYIRVYLYSCESDFECPMQKRISPMHFLRLCKSLICFVSIVWLALSIFHMMTKQRKITDNQFHHAPTKQSSEPTVFREKSMLLEKYVSAEEHEIFLSNNGDPKSYNGGPKWIVITTIFPPTADVRHMAERLTAKGWRIVIVGDERTSPDWTYPNCTYLSWSDQKSMRYKIMKFLPKNSYSRKAIGYLYAIQHGARYVYDTDDDNRFLGESDLKYFLHGNTTKTSVSIGVFQKAPAGAAVIEKSTREKCAKPAFFNTYAHFGRPDIWPRGYPLQMINAKCDHLETRLSPTGFRAAIQQGLVEQDPDVDALYRLIFYPGHDKNSTARRDFYIKFDDTAPSVYLGPGVYTPFNSQNTLFLYEALWALILPVTTTFRVCDIWRAYWSTRLLWEVGEGVAFFPSNARQARNPHTIFKDFLQERKLYENTSELAQFLDSWRCANDTLPMCGIDLAYRMAEKGFWGAKDAQLIEAWFEDLTGLKYVFPKLVASHEVPESTWRVNYVSQFRKNDQERENAQFSAARNLAEFCAVANVSFAYKAFAPVTFEHTKRVVLIIVFNHPHHENIQLLRWMYEPWFAHVAFCSSFSENSTENFTFAHISPEEMYHGIFSYECDARIMSFGMHNIDGYLVIGDDLLLNFWTSFDTGKMHMNKPTCKNALIHPDGMVWWNSTWGEAAIAKIADMLEKPTDTVRQVFGTDFRDKLLEILPSKDWCRADIFYIPLAMSNNFTILAHMFKKAEVFVEIAVPKILTTLGWSKDDASEDFNGKYLEGRIRLRLLTRSFNASGHFLHPFKMSRLKELGWRKWFCDKYARSWFDAVNGKH